MWNKKIYIASEADGLNARELVMLMEIDPMRIQSKEEFEQAAISASTEYCLSNEGKTVFKNNCNCFNWGDFDTHVPNSICEKYGIRKCSSNIAAVYCFDQQLVDEAAIFPETEQIRAINIEWDTDENEDHLPINVIVPDEYIPIGDYDADEFAEEISDWLSDEYEFCHKGFELVFMTSDDLKEEEEKLKRAIYDAGVNAIEEFLGHSLENDSTDTDIESEMDDALTNIPDEEYLQYLAKYCGKQEYPEI